MLITPQQRPPRCCNESPIGFTSQFTFFDSGTYVHRSSSNSFWMVDLDSPDTRRKFLPRASAFSPFLITPPTTDRRPHLILPKDDIRRGPQSPTARCASRLTEQHEQRRPARADYASVDPDERKCQRRPEHQRILRSLRAARFGARSPVRRPLGTLGCSQFCSHTCTYVYIRVHTND